MGQTEALLAEDQPGALLVAAQGGDGAEHVVRGWAGKFELAAGLERDEAATGGRTDRVGHSGHPIPAQALGHRRQVDEMGLDFQPDAADRRVGKRGFVDVLLGGVGGQRLDESGCCKA